MLVVGGVETTELEDEHAEVASVWLTRLQERVDEQVSVEELLVRLPSVFHHYGIRVVLMRIITGSLEGWEAIPMGKQPSKDGGVSGPGQSPHPSRCKPQIGGFVGGQSASRREARNEP